jgi:predicted ATPase
MAIKRAKFKDFLVFKGEFTIDFCYGVNVIIGGNGTGKTTLLKLLYASIMNTKGNAEQKPRDVSEYFIGKTIETSTDENERQNDGVIVKINDANAKHKQGSKVVISYSNLNWLLYDSQSVYIPSTEMLSHSKGFLALNKKYIIPFDATYADIIANAELPEAREISELNGILLNKISKVIDGKVVFENDEFYIQKTSGIKISFPYEAKGFCKFGLLWKLLHNGLLERKSVLFWDEPENSLNPELISALAEILLELQRGGVQIFLATHSEILASYFDVLKKNNDNVMFHSLYKDGEQIKADSNDRFDLLNHNMLTEEPVKLYEKKLDRSFSNE